MTRFTRPIPFALTLILVTGLTSPADAAVRSDLVGTWELTSVSELGTTVRSLVVPEKGSATLDEASIKDLVIDDNEITFSVVITVANERYPLDFEGTYDKTVIVGEFLMGGQVVALVDVARVKTGGEGCGIIE